MDETGSILSLDPATQFVTVNDPSPTVSVRWDVAAQMAVVAEGPGPTIASRAYAMTHTAIFDAWAAYDPVAVGVHSDLPPEGAATDEACAEAMSWAAFTVLSDLFPAQAEIFEQVMADLGLAGDTALPGTPAALGVAAGEAVLAARADDGANQANGYADTTGYAPVNPGPFEILDITRWTPENVPIDPEDADPEQSFLTAHWATVTPFGLDSPAAVRPPAPEPFFVEGVEAELDLETATITFQGPDAPAPVPVTPDLVGPVINPGFIAQAEEVVAFSAELTDEGKLIAEFWEDAAGTSFPPGTFMTFGQFVSARDDHTLHQDAKMFLALGNAVMDSGIATWEAKVFYDYVRPVRAIRDLGELGLIGTPGVDALTGQEGHFIEAWAGPGLDAQTVLADNFITYQTPGLDVSPPFAEYTSGHSGFSAAGAAVLELAAASDAFGGAVTFAPGSSRFEPGITPSEPVTLAWDTFSEAADEAGLSRLYGGIHFTEGDRYGRAIGAEAGEAAFRKTMEHVSGAVAEAVPEIDAALADAVSVGRMFEAAFGRVAQVGGLNHWEDALEDGRLSPAALGEAFLRSDEFAARHGPAEALAPEALADTLLLNLGLDADATELDEALAARLEAGDARGTVLADLVASEDAAIETRYLAGLAEGEDGLVWFV